MTHPTNPIDRAPFFHDGMRELQDRFDGGLRHLLQVSQRQRQGLLDKAGQRQAPRRRVNHGRVVVAAQIEVLRRRQALDP